MTAPAIELHDVCRTLGEGETAVKVLYDVSLTIQRGEFCSIIGPSGSGKSTLMYLLGALDRPDSGSVLIDGQDTKDLSDTDLGLLRNRKLGFIFQFHYLLAEFTAQENVMMPMLKADVSVHDARERAKELLGLMGIGEKFHRVPSRLSGGEQQRVAIARSLANHPIVVLGDEPTGNLDTTNAENVFGVFEKLVHDRQQTIVVVTHDPRMAAKTQRVIELVDGRIVADGPPSEVLKTSV